MEKLLFDLTQKGGKFKILNATNGGPWHKRHAVDQVKSNFNAYKAARIPYARNHDSGVAGVYGGPFSHDILRIFPNFDADENDPASYDFACTDESILATLEAGTETFFRLGQTIEHQIKKHMTLPPKDFHKWARVCEHIIRHYNEGWADGFQLNIQYWEIWNEPDLDEDDSPNKRTWGGTWAQFFDLYEIAAKHLKSCFPHLKIGGPALAYRTKWADDFLAEMRKRNVPIDFFSWHIYSTSITKVMDRSVKIREIMEKHGYGDAESILNEWNYVRDFSGQKFIDSIKAIGNEKGAAFVLGCISEAQKSSIDMLMYYATMPGVFCGAFDFYTAAVKKPYYALYWYGMFYDMECEVRCQNQPEDIYTLCGVDADGKVLATVTYYTDEEETAPAKRIALDFGKKSRYEVYCVNSAHDGELIKTTSRLKFKMQPNTMLLIKEK